MKAKEYAQFQANVARNTAHLSFISTGFCAGCNECGEVDPGDPHGDRASEPFFSWQPCECCGSSLGGDRHAAHGRDKEQGLEHFTVCIDCLYFLNYGRLDDQSMAEIENETH